MLKAMKKLVFIILALLVTGMAACAAGSKLTPPSCQSAESKDAGASAVALAQTIPLLTVNLNNYKHPANPILAAGAAGEWDAAGIERVAVIRLAPNDWRMWYACTGPRRSIGLATSKDGIRWTKHPGNPLLEPTEAWEGDSLSPTSVLQVNGKFYLYYWGPGHVQPDRQTGKLPPPKLKYIGLANSDDGIHWTRQGSVDGHKGAVLGPEPPGINEDLASGGSGVDAAKVFYLPEERSRPWRMIYTGFGRHGQWNGLAESDDGVVWHRTTAPIADHSGFYTRATGNHRMSGQTIRCPVRIGSVWAGLSFELDSRDSAPIVGLTLDRWVTLGRRTLYRNQDYEQGALHPWTIEADDEWFYLYYSTGHRSVGLIRAPKRSVHQPMLVWDGATIPAVGAKSKILEPDGARLAAWVSSDRAGTLRVLIQPPGQSDWSEAGSAEVTADRPVRVRLPSTSCPTRLSFAPHDGPSTVRAWCERDD